jgi:hypothetical protein
MGMVGNDGTVYTVYGWIWLSSRCDGAAGYSTYEAGRLKLGEYRVDAFTTLMNKSIFLIWDLFWSVTAGFVYSFYTYIYLYIFALNYIYGIYSKRVLSQ